MWTFIFYSFNVSVAGSDSLSVSFTPEYNVSISSSSNIGLSFGLSGRHCGEV